MRRLVISLLLIAFASIFITAAQKYGQQKSRDVPYVPTPQTVVEEMLKIAAVKKGDAVYDLGSGDGRIVITAAKKYQARGVGVDIDPERIKKANAKRRRGWCHQAVEIH